MSRHPVGLIAASTLALIAAQARAQADPAAPQPTDSGGQVIAPPPQPDPDPKLTFSLTPYLFISSLKVDVAGGPTGAGNYTSTASFLDLLKHLKFGFMAGGEVGYGRFGAIGDIIYASTEFGAQPRDPNLAFISATTTAKMLLTTLEGRYRLVDQPRFRFDATVGARISDVRLAVNIYLPRQTLSGNANKTWAVPVVGVGDRRPFGAELCAGAYADGGSTGKTYTWQAYGGFSYRASSQWDVALGYRYYDMNYTNQPQSVNIALYGPVISGTYRF